MSDEPVPDSPLFDLDSFVLTPHVAWYAERSLVELRRKATENAVRVVRGERPHGVVDENTLPQGESGRGPGSDRRAGGE